MNYDHYLRVLARQVDNRDISPEMREKSIGAVPIPGDPVSVPTEFVAHLADDPMLNNRGHYLVATGTPAIPGFSVVTMARW